MWIRYKIIPIFLQVISPIFIYTIFNDSSLIIYRLRYPVVFLRMFIRKKSNKSGSQCSGFSISDNRIAKDTFNRRRGLKRPKKKIKSNINNKVTTNI